ncbi:hypothetical protein ACLHWY_27140 [Priestia aryabhattai]|uniref:hypothetical protein n=1 Tax=Priestia aryabhattai TaxID=412384 RepID=UPI0039833EAD
MLTTTTTNQVTIKETIKELEKAFILMNSQFFNNELTPVHITLHTENKRVPTWYVAGKVWDSGERELSEINITVDCLKYGKMAVLQSLMHELIHHLANIREESETSRNGHWHNKVYKRLAEEVGMYYPDKKADSKSGYSNFEFPKEAYDMINAWGLDDNAFIWHRNEIDGKKKTKTTSYKWTCFCPRPQIVRTSKPELRAICPDCNEQFKLSN